jgi:hypothetical protein
MTRPLSNKVLEVGTKEYDVNLIDIGYNQRCEEEKDENIDVFKFWAFLISAQILLTDLILFLK